LLARHARILCQDALELAAVRSQQFRRQRICPELFIGDRRSKSARDVDFERRQFVGVNGALEFEGRDPQFLEIGGIARAIRGIMITLIVPPINTRLNGPAATSASGATRRRRSMRSGPCISSVVRRTTSAQLSTLPHSSASSSTDADTGKEWRGRRPAAPDVLLWFPVSAHETTSLKNLCADCADAGATRAGTSGSSTT
jgi:hypothetical protein